MKARYPVAEVRRIYKQVACLSSENEHLRNHISGLEAMVAECRANDMQAMRWPAAANDIAQRVAMIVSEQACVDIKSVTNETLLVADLGMDSLDLIECTMAIEEAFGIEIDDAEDERCASVADVIAMVERKGGAA